MEDSTIIDLFVQRKETAISESQAKYGTYCSVIANHILNSKEDSEECVNDTWLRAWNTIPPHIPQRLAVFFGKITRNLAIDKFRSDRTKKHGGGQITMCLDELSECISEASPIEDTIMLRDVLNTFLSELPEKNRDLFLLRYWYIMPINEIAERYGMTDGAVKMTLMRIRKKLKARLDKEGVGI